MSKVIDDEQEYDAEVAEMPRGPHIPKGAKRPQDRKAPKKTAAQIEAEGIETIDVEYGGQSYEFPADVDEADGGVLEAIDRQALTVAIRLLLPAEDWARFRKTKPKVGDYKKLFAAYGEEAGFGEGN